ncbi:MAG: DUF3301 domain-containing protein, partial [Pseudomonadales bacterium]|nr:DUF3301 domain-containing protein [Pseudomonadales bacterium]
MRCKDLAIAAARRECKICDVQFLDHTVQLVRLSMSRDRENRWRIWREYRFEYSEDGQERLSGQLSMLGQQVIRVALETFNPVIH